MKVNLPFVKLVTRLLVLFILFVTLFLISAFLYSAQYWKDVYTYFTPNITIKRIPTISELNLTEYQVTTEFYSTTDFYDYSELSTIRDGFGYDFYNISEIQEELLPYNKRTRRASDDFTRIGDYSILPNKTVTIDVFYDYDDGSRLHNDLLNTKKIATRALDDIEVFKEINDTEPHMTEENLEDNGSCHGNETTKSIEEVIFPWIAAIFVRNGSTNQFEYICDGAIVDRHSILTAARCLMNSPNDTVIPADVIAILGKRSLQTMDDNDVKRIKVIKIHENFLNHEDKVENDLAILVTEEEITFSPRVQTACVLKDPGEVKDAVSTGWRFSGELIAIHFNKQTDTSCLTTATDNIFCSRYGFDVSTCPSFGGLYVVKQQENVWYLSGILSEDPTNRGLCINRSLRYTYIVKYIDWIETNIS